MHKLVHRCWDYIPYVGVLGYDPQGELLTTAADYQRRMRPL